MSSIDERIVQMEFDNSLFDKNVESSIKTLEKLNVALKMDGVEKNISDIASSVNKMDFSKVESNVSGLQDKFSSLTDFLTKGVTDFGSRISRAISGEIDKAITNALQSAQRLAKEFTIEPIKQGFGEYELKMGSIQTIMAGTGESLANVNKYLDELNTYADKTIYSFSDMTSSIGKFTNAGVELGPAVKAIQGISNVAALAGANTSQASHAMYNFAQALSSGYVKLIDWKSIENANMATKEFKETLIDTAVNMGTLVKEGDKYVSTTTNMQGKVSGAFDAVMGFNDSLAHQWMTTDVLTAALSRYSDEMDPLGQKAFAAATEVKTFSQLIDTLKEAIGSGWAKTFELFIGDFEQAKALFTDINDVLGTFIDNMSDSRNSLLEEVLGGTTKAAEEATSEINAATEATDQLSKSFESYQQIANEVQNGEWGDGEERMKRLTEAGYDYEKVMAVVNHDILGWELNMDQFAEATGNAAAATESAKNATEALGEANKKTGRELLIESFANIAKSAIGIFKTLGEAWRELFPPVTAEALKNAINIFHSFTEQLSIGNLATYKLRNTFKGLLAPIRLIMDAVSGVVRGVFNPLVSVAKTLVDWLFTILSPIGRFISEVAKAAHETDFFYKIVSGIVDFVKPLFSAIGDIGNSVFKVIGSTLLKVGNVILDIGNVIHNFWVGVSETEGFKKFASAFEAVGKVFSNIKDTVVGGITGFFDSIANTSFKLPDIDVGSIVEKVGNAFGWVADKITWFRDDVLLPFIDSIKNDSSNPFHGIYEFFSNLSFQGILDTVADKFNRVRSAISGFLKETGLATKAQELFSRTINNIKDNAPKIFSSLWKIISKVGSVIVSAKDRIVEFWAAFKETEAWQTIKTTVIDTFKNLLDGAITIGNKLRDTFTSLFGSASEAIGNFSFPKLDMGEFAENVSEKLQWALEKFSNFKEKVSALFSAGKSIGSNMLDMIVTFFTKGGLTLGIESMTSGLGKAKDAIVSFFEKVKEFLFGTDVSAAVPGSEAIKSISKNAPKATGFINKLTEAVRKVIKAFQDFFKGLSGSGSAKALTETKDTVEDTTSAFDTFMGVLDKVKSVISKVWDIIGPIWKGLTTIKVGRKLAGMFGSIGKVAENFAGIGAGIKNLVGNVNESVSTLTKSFSREANSRAIRNLAIALGILAASFFVLSQISWDQFKVAAAGIGVLTIALIALMAAFRLFFGGGSGGFGKQLSPVETFQQTMATFGEKMSKALSKFGTAAIILSFAVAIKMLVDSVEMLGLMNPAQLVKGTLAIAALSAILAGATALVSKFGGNAKVRTALVLVTFALTIKMLANTTEKLGQIKTAVLKKGLKTLAVIALILTASVSITSISTKNAKTGPIIAMILGIVAVALSLVALSNLDPAKLRNAADALTETLLGVAAMAGTMALLGKFSGIASTIVSVVAIGAVLAALYLLFREMQDFDAASMDIQADAFVKMCLALLEIGAAVTLLGTAGVLTTLRGTFSAGLIMAAFGGLFYLAGILKEKVPGVAAAIEAGVPLMESIAGGIGRIIGAFVGGIMDGFTDQIMGTPDQLLEFTEKLKDPLAAAEGLSADPIDNISSIFLSLAGLQISEAINNIAAFLTGSDTAEDAKQTLIDFADVVKAYSDELTSNGGIDGDAIEKSKKACEIAVSLGTLTPNSGGAIQKFFGESEPGEYGAKLVLFAAGMVGYSHIIANMNTDAVEGTQEAVKHVLILAKSTPETGGFLQDILGESEPGKYGAKLIPFAMGLVGYSKIIANMDTEAVEGSKSAASSVIELAAQTPNTGGLYQDIMGEPNPENFGKKLVPFAEGLKGYSDVIKDMNVTAVSRSEAAANIIIKLANSVEPTGGLVGWILGDANLEDLGSQLGGFADAMVTYSQKVSGYNFDPAKEATQAVVDLVEVFNKLNAEGGFHNIDAAEAELTRVQTAIYNVFAALSDAIESYSLDGAVAEWAAAINSIFSLIDDIKVKAETQVPNIGELVFGSLESDGISATVTNAVTSLIQQFSDLVKEKFDTAIPDITNNSLVPDLKTMITDAGTAFTDSSDEFHTSFLDATVGNDLKKDLILKGKNIIHEHLASVKETYATDFTSVSASVLSIVRQLFTDVNSTVNTYGALLMALVRGITNSTAQIITDSKPGFVQTIYNICAEMHATASRFTSGFEGLGRDMMYGLANGINWARNFAINAAINASVDALNAAKRAVDSNSPSKAFEQLGIDDMRGLGIGITKSAGIPMKAAADVSEGTMQSMSAQVGDFSDDILNSFSNSLKSVYAYVDAIVNHAIDSSPVITPIMDLSSVKRGADGIDSILSDTFTYGGTVMPYAQAGLQAVTSANASTTNADLVYAIQGLRSDMQSLTGANGGTTLNDILNRMNEYFPQFANSNVTLDSGETIGSLTPGISAQMRTLSNRNR